MLLHSIKVPFLRKKTLEVHLKKIVNTELLFLTTGNYKIQIIATDFLRDLVLNFTSSMRPYVDEIEKTCRNTLQSSSFCPVYLKKALFSCLASLPHTGRVNQTAEESWRLLCLKIVANIHHILNFAFSCVKEEKIYFPEDSESELNLKKDIKSLDMDTSLLSVYLLRRLVVECALLQELLLSGFSSVVALPLQQIFDIVTRIINLDSCFPKYGKNLDWRLLSFSFVSYYHCGLDLLCALLSLRPLTGALARKTSYFEGIVKKLLDSAAFSTPLKLKVYSLCSKLLRNFHLDFELNFISIVFRDALNALTALAKPKSLGEDPAASSTDLFLHAADVIAVAISFRPLKIREDLLNELQSWICAQLVSLNTFPHSIDPLFTNLACLCSLYELLLKFLVNSISLQLSLLNKALRLFHEGLFSDFAEISNICHNALRVCSFIVHPRVPSLPPRPSSVRSTSLLTPIVGGDDFHNNAFTELVETGTAAERNNNNYNDDNNNNNNSNSNNNNHRINSSSDSKYTHTPKRSNADHSQNFFEMEKKKLCCQEVEKLDEENSSEWIPEIVDESPDE